jgi:Ca2+:H+ antiporter
MKNDELPHGAMHPAHRAATLSRVTPQAVMQHILPMHKGMTPSTSQNKSAAEGDAHPEPNGGSSSNYNLPAGYTPFLDTVDNDMKAQQITPMRLPSSLTTEDFTRAVAVATVSALRHQCRLSRRRSRIGSEIAACG